MRLTLTKNAAFRSPIGLKRLKSVTLNAAECITLPIIERMADDEGAMVPRTGGYGLGMKKFIPEDPQWWMAGTNHPISPFPGDGVDWESNVYDDGTTYEGLVREGVPHGRGVLVVGLEGGAGINRGPTMDSTTQPGDKFEGEFYAGFANGLGMYTAANGTRYKGEWRAGQKNGCGVVSDVSPFLRRLAEGQDTQTAWNAAREEIEASTVMGTWRRDYYVGGPDPSGSLCPLAEIKGVAEEVDEVVTKARMFRHKPEGEATLRTLQVDRGVPAKTMQDPLDYPLGTKFLAPGPAGQLHPVPENPALRSEMRAAGDVWQRIFESYNLRWHDPKPGSDLDKALKRWQRQKKDDERKKRKEEELKRRKEARLAAQRSGADGAAAAAAAAAVVAPATPSRKEDDGDVDDDDLVASAELMRGRGAVGGFPAPTSHAFASVSQGLSRATLVMHHTFRGIAERLQGRPVLGHQQCQPKAQAAGRRQEMFTVAEAPRI